MALRRKGKAIAESRDIFAIYAPIAEKMLCLVEQSDGLDKKQADIARKRICGTSLRMIADEHDTSKQQINRWERKAFDRLSDFDQPLLSTFSILRNATFTDGDVIRNRREYNSRQDVKERERDRRIRAHRKKLKVKAKNSRYFKKYYKRNRQEIMDRVKNNHLEKMKR